jgi:hypothetical protein
MEWVDVVGTQDLGGYGTLCIVDAPQADVY